MSVPVGKVEMRIYACVGNGRRMLVMSALDGSGKSVMSVLRGVISDVCPGSEVTSTLSIE